MTGILLSLYDVGELFYLYQEQVHIATGTTGIL